MTPSSPVRSAPDRHRSECSRRRRVSTDKANASLTADVSAAASDHGYERFRAAALSPTRRRASASNPSAAPTNPAQ